MLRCTVAQRGQTGSAQQGFSGNKRSSMRRLPGLARPSLKCNAEEPGKGGSEGEGDLLESLFQQEVERRKAAAAAGQSRPSGSNRGSTPPPSFSRDAEVPPQLERSRALNSEGLEGLIPRASELIKLGVAFGFAFVPFALAVALAFGGLYSVFGDAFIHGGSAASSLPSFIDPELLLREDTLDPMVPFYN